MSQILAPYQSPARVHDLERDSGGAAVKFYVSAVAEVIRRGAVVPAVRDSSSIGSSFGAGRSGTRELLSHVSSVDLSRPALVTSAARPVDVVFACGFLLWTLAGSNSATWISHYNPRGADFSDDGAVLAGAPGPHLMDSGHGLPATIRILRQDPSSRRAQIMFPPPEAEHSRDVSCQQAMQYWLRDGVLRALTTMRSQSVMMLLPYDLFFATSIQCIAASSLDVPPGQHDYFAASAHVYEDEVQQAERLLGSDVFALPFAPIQSGLRRLPELLQFERRLRLASLASDRDRVVELSHSVAGEPTEFWDQVKMILAAGALEKAGLPAEGGEFVQALGGAFKDAFALRADRQTTS